MRPSTTLRRTLRPVLRPVLRPGVLVGLVLSLAAPLGLIAAADAAPAPRESRAARAAHAALEEVRTALDGRAGQRHDLTSAYRELFVNQTALTGRERHEASHVLARPTTPQEYPGDPRDIYYGEDFDLQSVCDAHLCLHWVEEGEHAATADYAADVFATLQQVAAQYVAAGFKRPLPDEGEEGSTKTDFYLGELDEVGALGFCRSDYAAPTIGSAYAAFCGIDNDFETFDGWPGIRQVTIAHEYFHAVQFAYDAEDAGWIYESTAAWIEDEVFDDVDDSAFFLNFGQMGDPDQIGYPFAGPTFPLDVLDDFGGFNTYGNWGFWRFLTERHPAEAAGIPTLVRDFWQSLDTTAGPNPTTARQALDQVLAARGDDIPDAYAGFAAANQSPADFYEEGYQYPTAPDTYAAVALSRTAPSATREATLDHLTSASGVATPFAGSSRLKVRVEQGFTGLRTVVVVHGTDGSVSTVAVATNPQGKGEATVPFGPSVAFVEVTSAHGGTADGQVTRVRFQAVG